jgi:hypothetical protein
MSRPTDWSALALDHDPTPGEPATIRELANHVRDIAEGIRSSLERFTQLDSVDFWESEHGSADGFKELKGELPGDLGIAAARYENVAGALDTWVDALSGVQSRADDALRRANEARDDLAYANSGIEDMEEWKESAERTAREHNEAHPDAPEVQPESWSGQDYYGLKSDAEERLRQAKEDVGSAKTDRDTAADDAGRVIEDAANDKLKNKHWFKKFLLGLADVLSVAAAIVGILAIFFPVLAPLALGLAIASAALTFFLYTQGDKTLEDVGWEVLGLLTMGIGRVGIAGVRAFKAMPAFQKGLAATQRLVKARGILTTPGAKLPTILGKAVNPATGKTMSGAALARNTLRLEGEAAAREIKRMSSVYNRIMYPAKPTWKGNFGSWDNITNTAANSWNEIKASAGAYNGINGLAVTGADIAGTGISAKQTVDAVGNFISSPQWGY